MMFLVVLFGRVGLSQGSAHAHANGARGCIHYMIGVVRIARVYYLQALLGGR